MFEINGYCIYCVNTQRLQSLQSVFTIFGICTLIRRQRTIVGTLLVLDVYHQNVNTLTHVTADYICQN